MGAESQHRSRLAIILPWMGGGGVERVGIGLMHGALASGLEVDLVLTEEGGNFMHLVPPEVHVELFKCRRIRHTVPRLRDYFRRRRPDAAMVSVWPLTATAMLARLGLRHSPRLVLSDHNHLTSQYGSTPRIWWQVKATLRWLYPHAEGLIGVSDGVSEDVARIAKLPRERVTTIYNPISPPERHDFSAIETDPLWQGKPGKRIVAVGRFKRQKNQALLLQAFAKLKESGTEAVLALLGEGELDGEIRAQIAQLGLADHVLMPGFVVEPSPWFASAELFVLSSDYEGFGNVLVEAMHFGTPVVSTDCPSGPAEILENGRFGRLVPVGDETALASAMYDELAEPTAAEELQARAGDFSIDRAIRRYLHLALPDFASRAQI